MDMETNKTIVLEAIRRRRSTRAFLKDPVPEEIINEIIDAGRHAPSANNTQLTHLYVISTEEKRAELKAVFNAALACMKPKEGMSPSLLKLIGRAKEEEVDFTYGAPVLIVSTHRKDSPNAAADCACVLENMMLAASVSGIACVWINQFFSLRSEQPIIDFFASLGVSEDETIFGSLSLGYAESIASEPLPRTGFPVTYIR